MSVITTVIIARQRRYLRTFKQAGAVSPGSSILLSDHGIGKSMIFNRLVRQGVIVPVGEDRYYLDEQKEQEISRKRLPVLIAALFLVLILFLLIMNTSR